jgi:hypothetical protein
MVDNPVVVLPPGPVALRACIICEMRTWFEDPGEGKLAAIRWVTRRISRVELLKVVWNLTGGYVSFLWEWWWNRRHAGKPFPYHPSFGHRGTRRRPFMWQFVHDPVADSSVCRRCRRVAGNSG